MNRQKIEYLIQQELMEQKLNTDNEKYAFLSGVVRGSADLGLSRQGLSIIIQSTNKNFVAYTQKVIESLIEEELPYETNEIDMGYKKATFCTLTVPSIFANFLLIRAEIITGVGFETVAELPTFLTDISVINAFFKGLYLSCGFTNTPQELDLQEENINKSNKGYHLEFVPNTINLQDKIANLLAETYSIEIGDIHIRSNGKSGIYIKKSQIIAELLGYLGCVESSLKLFSVIVSRDMNNKLNRKQNCDIANINKQTEAAAEQTQAIMKIQDSIGLDKLEPNLQAVAKLRLENDESSLNELALLSNPPLTKSGIRHRMRKIMLIASELE